jgi:hypothetical protein
MWYCVFSSFFFLINAIVSYIYSQYAIGTLWVLLCVTSIIFHSLRRANTSHLVNTDMIRRVNKKNKWLDVAYLFDITVTVVLVTYILYVHFRNTARKNMTPYVIFTNIVIFSLLGYILFIFFYGKQIGNYCFHKDSDTAEKWHSTIHLSGSIAHFFTHL